MMKISLWLSFLWILLLGNDFIQAGSPAGQWGQADISKHSRVSFVVRAKPQTENGLRRGHPVESNLAGGQAHKYLFTASANQFVRIVVVQQSLNVTVRLLDENGKSLAEVNSPNRNDGSEVLFWVTKQDAQLHVEVAASNENTTTGKYRLELTEMRQAMNTDAKRVAAQLHLATGHQFRKRNQWGKAIKEYQSAFKLWEAVGEQEQVAHNALLLGLTFAMQAESFAKYGEMYKGAVFFEQRLHWAQAATDSLKRSRVFFGRAGQLYNIQYYIQQIQLHRVNKSHQEEAGTVEELERILNNFGEHKKAGAYHELGVMYANLAERQLALKYYNQALPLWQAAKNKLGEAKTINNIGIVYYDLGVPQQALKYHDQALPLFRTAKDKEGEAMTLNNMGLAYSDLGDLEQALTYFNQVLSLHRDAGVLNNLGRINYLLGETQTALEYFAQALSLYQKEKDRTGEAVTLNNIGGAYSNLGDQPKALLYYQQALQLRRLAGDRKGEAGTLSNLMFGWKYLQQSHLAVYYGKQSVNHFQALRAAISGLDKALQHSFLKSKENTYRELADLLIGLGRLPEAQQVLDLLKEEEYFDYVRRDSNEVAGLKGRASLTPTEARLEKEYAEIADVVTALGKELEGFNQLKDPLPAQLARRTDLDQKLQLATQRFQAFLGRLEKELGNTKESGERLTLIQAGEGFQDTLRELGTGTVALYTILSEKKYSVILTPASGPQVAAEYNISREDLHKKIFALKDALKNPKVDPRLLATELYDILIAPIAKNLEGAKAETLMFSLDGALRYLPMAALYDKQRGQYLIEKYRVVMYTPAGASDLKNAARANWKGLGFGVSKEVSNAEVGRFRALTGVPGELSSVIRSGNNPSGVMEGQVYLDEQFTEQRFLDALRPREYPLIHIASHFAFKPGDSLKSFLLLGDGHGLTLEKVKNTPSLFSGVDLLALSACETGVGQKDEEGNEVEGFGVLAQRKGAKAVL